MSTVYTQGKHLRDEREKNCRKHRGSHAVWLDRHQTFPHVPTPVLRALHSLARAPEVFPAPQICADSPNTYLYYGPVFLATKCLFTLREAGGEENPNIF